MIGYFLKAGDDKVSDMFSNYIWGEKGFGTLLEKNNSAKTYGKDLKLLPIQYYVKGKFSINGPENPTVNNYSHKNKDISIAITVKPEDFHNCDENARKLFILNSTLLAVELVLSCIN